MPNRFISNPQNKEYIKVLSSSPLEKSNYINELKFSSTMDEKLFKDVDKGLTTQAIKELVTNNNISSSQDINLEEQVETSSFEPILSDEGYILTEDIAGAIRATPDKEVYKVLKSFPTQI